LSGTSVIGIIGIAASVLLGLIFALLRGLLSKEVEASLPAISRNLLLRAAHRLPEEHRERFLEEWNAEFAEAIRGRPLWAVLQAASLYRSARKIAAELQPAAVAVPGQPGSTKVVTERANRFLGGVLLRLTAIRSAMTAANKQIEARIERIVIGPNPRMPNVLRLLLALVGVITALISAIAALLALLEGPLGL
jgi:hypothetical protein